MRISRDFVRPVPVTIVLELSLREESSSPAISAGEGEENSSEEEIRDGWETISATIVPPFESFPSTICSSSTLSLSSV